ncbi:putative uncharacterized protein DDB_G0282133 [Monomorium pharaonis]|uniref:putative uncharacterized protein DDB_G0282133 n=1 Tax=Monomorium pharaonis TaxID=307658 RepID=UPI00063FB0A6|nr:putative uncharacterized protein DDB_G0282133 [Monomorium pharaonis]
MRVLYIFLLSVFIGSVFGRATDPKEPEFNNSNESGEVTTKSNELNGSNETPESNDSNSTPTPNKKRSSNKESTIDDTGNSLTTECNNHRGPDSEEEKNPNKSNDRNNFGDRMFSDMTNMLRKIGRI